MPVQLLEYSAYTIKVTSASTTWNSSASCKTEKSISRVCDFWFNLWFNQKKSWEEVKYILFWRWIIYWLLELFLLFPWWWHLYQWANVVGLWVKGSTIYQVSRNKLYLYTGGQSTSQIRKIFFWESEYLWNLHLC